MKEANHMTLDAVCNFAIIFLSLIMFVLIIGNIVHEQQTGRVSLFEIMYLLAAPSVSMGLGLGFQWGWHVICGYGFMLLVLNMALNNLAEERNV